MASRTYPVSLLVQDQACLVVGGGPVAASKLDGLVHAGAAVTLVAPAVVDTIERLAERTASVTLLRRAYEPGEAARFRLVITATGVAEVDAAVASDARAAGVWVNSADDPQHCTFLLPSVHRDGPVTVAVSTGGASPSLAAWLRRRLAEACGEGLGALAELLGDARQRVRSSGRPTSSVPWRALLDGELPSLVRRGQLDDARRLLNTECGTVPHEGRT